MPDFPAGSAVAPPFIHSWSFFAGGAQRAVSNPGGPTALTWTANVAVYIPLELPFPYYVQRAFWWNGSTVSGSADVGIYTVGGAQLWHAGSTTATGATLPQFVTVQMLLNPGRYFLAFAQSGTTSVAEGVAMTAPNGRLMGLYQQSTALPLPATATFAAYAAVGLPLIGITSTASGF